MYLGHKTARSISSAALALAMLMSILGGCHADNTSSTGSSSPASLSEETSATSTETVAAVTGRTICASFIQPWLAEGWGQERWNTECSNMVEAGMKYLILQSVVDLAYNTTKDLGDDKDAYTLSSASSLYPSDIELLKDANSGYDSLKLCLEACKSTGIQVIIGPLSDDRWWMYGWGDPTMPSGATDAATESYMAEWVAENGELSNEIADEIMEKYGDAYGDQIYGWYYNNEVWNIDVACAGTDDGVYAKIISNSLNLALDHYSDLTPGKPMMLSPYCNPSLSSADECGQMWQDIFALTHFRSGDIFAPQDSYGGYTTKINLDDWGSAYKEAVDTKSGLLYWSNNENFRSNDAIAEVGDFINKQVNVTAKYASANICFSWNHYYSPVLKNPGYNNAYVYYVKNGVLESEAPSTPVLTADGLTITWDATDNMAICGIHVYRNKTTNLVKTVKTSDAVNGQISHTVTVDIAGTYYVSVYDYSGNESELAEITVS